MTTNQNRPKILPRGLEMPQLNAALIMSALESVEWFVLCPSFLLQTSRNQFLTAEENVIWNLMKLEKITKSLSTWKRKERSNNHLEQMETIAPTQAHGRLLLYYPNNKYAYLKSAWDVWLQFCQILSPRFNYCLIPINARLVTGNGYTYFIKTRDNLEFTFETVLSENGFQKQI